MTSVHGMIPVHGMTPVSCMKRTRQRGVAYVEFGLSMAVLLPLTLGVISIGLNMHLQLQTVQLARDAGHMFARGVDFTLLGNQQVLVAVGGSLGLSTTAGSGTAVVMLSQVRYVDVAACTQAGKVDTHGNPSGCTNYQRWVFAQRIAIGNTTVHTSNLGSPPGSIVAADGSITLANQVTNAGDVATLPSFSPWNSVSGTGIPSGTVIYVSEAAATGFRMSPYTTLAITYAQNYF